MKVDLLLNIHHILLSIIVNEGCIHIMNKIEKLLVDRVVLRDDLKKLTKQICAHIGDCCKLNNNNFQNSQNEPHLFYAYKEFKNHPSPWNDKGTADEYLADTCEHCYKAHEVIQVRKYIKAEIGMINRKLSLIGRNLFKINYETISP